MVLKILSRKPGLHGYAIMTVIEEMSEGIARGFASAQAGAERFRYFARIGPPPGIPRDPFGLQPARLLHPPQGGVQRTFLRPQHAIGRN
jgi:hypothetical protein